MSITSLSEGSQNGIQLEEWVMFESQLFGELDPYTFVFLERKCTFLLKGLHKHEWHVPRLNKEKDVLSSIILSGLTSSFQSL
jgi:hypothetical protein